MKTAMNLKKTIYTEFSRIVTANYITVVAKQLDGTSKVFMANNTHPLWEHLRESVAKADFDSFVMNVDLRHRLVYSSTSFSIDETGAVFYNGELFNHELATILATMYQSGANVSDFERFIENVLRNPDQTAVSGLYRFITTNRMPLTPAGKILAYKIVGPNYMDLYAGKHRNRPGDVPTEPREKCVSDPAVCCAFGLHFCSLGYLLQSGYGSSSNNRLMLIEIDPADVVSVPTTYDDLKGRCCKYTVVSELDKSQIFTSYRDVITGNMVSHTNDVLAGRSVVDVEADVDTQAITIDATPDESDVTPVPECDVDGTVWVELTPVAPVPVVTATICVIDSTDVMFDAAPFRTATKVPTAEPVAEPVAVAPEPLVQPVLVRYNEPINNEDDELFATAQVLVRGSSGRFGR